MVIGELVRSAAQMLGENTRFEAEQIVMKAAGVSHTQLVTHGRDIEADDALCRKVTEMTRRRVDGEPLQYILGECEFMSLGFYVNKGVLIPRADTETLVEAVADAADGERGLKIIDICSGSGCVGISLARFLPDAAVDMLDVSDEAVKTAVRNVERNDVSDRVRAIRFDILSDCPNQVYDIAVSNPPYIETDAIETLEAQVRDHEPHTALDGGTDGLMFYRRITEIADNILRVGGILAFETGYDQADAVKSIMNGKFRDIRVIKDLCGNDRVVIGKLKAV